MTPLLLAGPTAVGKSEVAMLLAQKLGAEIVSVDSMQVYRGLDIGTAKPSPADRSKVTHHLVDVIGLAQPFDAAQFVHLAGAAVKEIQARGRLPLLCGGTGLYFKAFLDGLGDAPPSDPALRAELERTALPELLRELAKTDPVTYEAIDRNNPRRVIRALEVIRLTGRPFSAQRAGWKKGRANTKHQTPNTKEAPNTNLQPGGRTLAGRSHHSPGPSIHQSTNPPSPIQDQSSIIHHPSSIIPRVGLAFALSRPPSDLRRRIETRVDDMFRGGLVAETEALLKSGLADNRTASQALGYRQVIEHLRGLRSLPETVELVKTRTRQFAKRQLTWFRHQMHLTWINIEPDELPETTAAKILAILV